jgi:hypothetical protein
MGSWITSLERRAPRNVLIIAMANKLNSQNGVPETSFPIRPSSGRGVSKDRHAAYLIEARRTNLHQ